MTNARVFLGNSGSDANDTLLKLIRYHAAASGQPQRTKVIAREQGYHGVTLAAASLTGLASMHTHFQLPFEDLGILRTGSAHFYRFGLAGETEAEFVARRAHELEALIQAEDPNTIAAMIAEPISGAGGVIVPPEGYFEAITAVLDRYGIALWDDEVICGFGRLGPAFGADYYGLKPQMMACAKALSSAYAPISAAIISQEMAEVVESAAATTGVFGMAIPILGIPWDVPWPMRCLISMSATGSLSMARVWVSCCKPNCNPSPTTPWSVRPWVWV